MIRKTLLVLFIFFSISAFILIGYPYFFRGSLAEPQFEIDPAEGKVWLNSQIVLELRGSFSKKRVLESLEIYPPFLISEDNLKVEHIAKFPWHKRSPWAKTKIIINWQRKEILKPETEYKIRFAFQEFSFETITLPKIISTAPENGAENVKTHLPLKIIFNEEMKLDSRLIKIEPEIEISIVLASDTLFIQPRPRLKNSTSYTLTIKKGLRDKFNHSLREDFIFSFTTQPPPRVVKAQPSGENLPLDSQLKIVFDREVDKASVENSFFIEPQTKGVFQWLDDLTLIWKPNSLDYSTLYQVSVGGKSPEGDPILTYQWSFKTKAPPPLLKPQILASQSHPPLAQSGEKKIILTFDDCGYPPGGTNQILDILARYNAKAIFFPTGACVQQYPQIFERVIAEGHLIGNHTYSHPNLTQISLEEASWQIANGPPQAKGGYWRPTYGAHNQLIDQIATDLGYTLMIWDIDTRDWARRYPGGDQEILNIVLSQAFPGAIVLMHVHVENTIRILPTLIEKLKEAGYIISW